MCQGGNANHIYPLYLHVPCVPLPSPALVRFFALLLYIVGFYHVRGTMGDYLSTQRLDTFIFFSTTGNFAGLASQSIYGRCGLGLLV